MDTSIMRFAKSSGAIERGFLAAGITVAVVAAAQAVAIVLGWIFGFTL